MNKNDFIKFLDYLINESVFFYKNHQTNDRIILDLNKLLLYSNEELINNYPTSFDLNLKIKTSNKCSHKNIVLILKKLNINIYSHYEETRDLIKYAVMREEYHLTTDKKGIKNLQLVRKLLKNKSIR